MNKNQIGQLGLAFVMMASPIADHAGGCEYTYTTYAEISIGVAGVVAASV